MPTDEYYKVEVLKDTVESVCILIGALATIVHYLPKVIVDIKYCKSMLSVPMSESVLWEPEDEIIFEEVK